MGLGYHRGTISEPTCIEITSFILFLTENFNQYFGDGFIKIYLSIEPKYSSKITINYKRDTDLRPNTTNKPPMAAIEIPIT